MLDSFFFLKKKRGGFSNQSLKSILLPVIPLSQVFIGLCCRHLCRSSTVQTITKAQVSGTFQLSHELLMFSYSNKKPSRDLEGGNSCFSLSWIYRRSSPEWFSSEISGVFEAWMVSSGGLSGLDIQENTLS